MAKGYVVVVQLDPDMGVYTATVPAMPGLAAEAETKEDVLATMAVLMADWLEFAREDGCETPTDSPATIAAHIERILEDRAESGWDPVIQTAAVAPAVPAPV